MAARRKPVILMAGGRRSAARRGPDPLIEETLRLAGIDRPSVAYIGAASGDNAMFRSMIAGQLRKAGSGEVRLAPLCGARKDPQKAMRIIEDSHIVFISGGDVDKGMRILVGKGMTDFLRGQHRKGKLFFGMSAGSIMLAKHWVRWMDPEADSNPELFPCLGLAEVYCDTHDEEDSWEELQTLAQLVPCGSFCYGIPSGAALIVDPDGSVRAIGGEVHCFTSKNGKIARIKNLNP